MNRGNPIVLGAWCALIVVCAPFIARAEHPAAALTPASLPASYGSTGYGYPAEWSTADLTFRGNYLSPAQLAPAERYMLAGTQVSPATGQRYQPWIAQVADWCYQHQRRYGYVPAQLDAAAIAETRGCSLSALNGQELALLANPFANRPPLLNAWMQSPGDLHVRALTAEEIRHFTAKEDELAQRWRLSSQQEIPVVLYIRAYGIRGPIFEGFYDGELVQPETTPPPVQRPLITRPVQPTYNLPSSSCTSSG